MLTKRGANGVAGGWQSRITYFITLHWSRYSIDFHFKGAITRVDLKIFFSKRRV